MSALRKFQVPKDILVFSNEEVEYWHDSLNHMLARAVGGADPVRAARCR